MGKISDAAVTCRDSLQGKGTKEAYKPQSRPTPVRLMQRVSADLCGPITPQSVSGMRYFLVLVEHASRMFFVYFLREKSDAVGAINCLRIAYAENVTKEHLAVLESDNGGEFTTQELKTFLISKGIFHVFTAPYNPEQNGTAERANRTLLDGARTILIAAKLPRASGKRRLRISHTRAIGVQTQRLGIKSLLISGRASNRTSPI